MIGAGEQAFLGQGIGRQGDVGLRNRAGHDRAERRMVGAEGDHVLEIVEQDRHVEIDHADHLAAAGSGMAGEIFGAEQAILLGRHRGEQDRALRAHA
jgi:hypothetical protein